MISTAEVAFASSSLKDAGVRADGRGPFEVRPLELKFLADPGLLELSLGATRVLARASAELGPPFGDRASEGTLGVHLHLSPMSSQDAEPGKPSDAMVEASRLVERGLKHSRAVDLESLCVTAGRKVWNVRVDITVLDACGNIVDAASIAALAALADFRRPEVTVSGGQEITIHSPEEREPLPLALHHYPIATTFALFDLDGSPDSLVLAIDPTDKEESASNGRLTITLNSFEEICAIHKAGGCGISPSEVYRCGRIAFQKTQEITKQLKTILSQREVERQQVGWMLW